MRNATLHDNGPPYLIFGAGIDYGWGYVLVRPRPPQGLLGGRTEVPTSAWTHDLAAERALAAAPQVTASGHRIRWRRLPGVVTHTFTHFPLGSRRCCA